MTMLWAIFRHIQLFCLAFVLAAGTMLYAGLASGRMERGRVYLGLAEQFASVLARHPSFVAAMAGDVAVPDDVMRRAAAGPEGAVQAVSTTEALTPRVTRVRPAGDSLRGLRARQFAGLQPR